MVTMMSFTLKELAEELLLKPDTLRKKLNRSGEWYGIDDELPEKLTSEVIQEYAKPAPRRSDETIEAAKQLLGIPGANSFKETKVDSEPEKPAKINGNKPISLKEEKEDSAPETKPEPKGKSKRNHFVTVVLVIAVIWQMHHSAFVVMEISRMEGPPWIQIDGILFAFSIQFTALLLTIYEGKRWYLVLFAIIEFLINVVYYQPWEEGGNYPLTILISGTIAFTIYSYSDLFAKTRNDGLEDA